MIFLHLFPRLKDHFVEITNPNCIVKKKNNTKLPLQCTKINSNVNVYKCVNVYKTPQNRSIVCYTE